jgi:ketosteroid isomerase-like protein
MDGEEPSLESRGGGRHVQQLHRYVRRTPTQRLDLAHSEAVSLYREYDIADIDELARERVRVEAPCDIDRADDLSGCPATRQAWLSRFPGAIRLPTTVPRLDGVAGDDHDEAALSVSQRWWDDIWRDGNLDAIDELFTEPFVRHTGNGTERESRAAYKRRLGEFQRVLSRAETTVDDRVVDGDKVWTRATSKGINRETGERSVITWLLIQRIEDDRIAELWVATLPGVEWTD